MRYVSEEYNHIVQVALNTVKAQQQGALVEECRKELETLLANHKIQDVAVWLTALQMLTGEFFDKVTGTQIAVVTDEEVTA
jgi:hypothetical protein